MDQLSVRRRTYMLWPGWAPPSVDRDQLAEAGFYYTGEADEVRCYGCRQTFAGWKDGDVPLDVHRRRCPGCHVVISLDRKNPTYRPPQTYSVDTASVKLPADVEVDGPTGKRATEDCRFVDTETTQLNISSRSAPSTTTSLSHPGKLKAQVSQRHRWQA